MPVKLSIGGTLSRAGMSISQRAVSGIPAKTKKVSVQTTGRSLSLLSVPRVFHVFPGGELLSSAQGGSVEVIRALSQPLHFCIQTVRDCRRWGRLFTVLWFVWETVWLSRGGCVKETKGRRSECILRPENQTAEVRGESAGRQGCWRGWCLQEAGCWGRYPALHSWLKKNCSVPKCIESQTKEISTTNFFLFVWQM